MFGQHTPGLSKCHLIPSAEFCGLLFYTLKAMRVSSLTDCSLLLQPTPPVSYKYRTEAESVTPSTTSELEPPSSLPSVKAFFASPPVGPVGALPG